MSVACIFLSSAGSTIGRHSIDDATGSVSIKGLDDSSQSLSQEERWEKQGRAWTYTRNLEDRGPQKAGTVYTRYKL